MSARKYKQNEKAYYLDVYRWDHRIVSGTIFRVRIESIESDYPNSEFQQLTVCSMDNKDRFTTYNNMLYSSKRDAEDELYVQLERTRKYASDMLDYVRQAEKELSEA